jgi:hypothetical protein
MFAGLPVRTWVRTRRAFGIPAQPIRSTMRARGTEVSASFYISAWVRLEASDDTPPAGAARRCMVTCARCGEPIEPGDAFDLDHTDDRAGYLGASYQACNRGQPARDSGRRVSREW